MPVGSPTAAPATRPSGLYTGQVERTGFGSTFTLGVNLPWIDYGLDFGANGWRPSGGLATTPVPDSVRRKLEEMAALGVSVIRWFVFCDGRAGIRFDRDGRPTGLDDRVFFDLDEALAIASSNGLRILFVLFDFGWCHRRRLVNGVQLGGRRRTLIDPATRGLLLDRVVAPVLKRYGAHPGVWAWDLINEPEWVTSGLGTHNPFRAVSKEVMRAFIDEATGLAHVHASQPVTVGLASARWLSLVRGSALDFFQVHWYDHLDRRAPLEKPVADLEVDRPVILGEFPTRGSTRPVDGILRLAARLGYAGALFWSALASDRATDYAEGARGLGSFADASRPPEVDWS